MWISCILLFLLAYNKVLINAAPYDWLNLLSNKIAENHYHQLIILSDNFKPRTYDRDLVIKSLTNHTPGLVINLKILNTSSDEESVKMLLTVNPRQVSLYIVMAGSYESLTFFIDQFVRLSPKYTRPKCLVMVQESKDAGKYIESILQYAWSKKFLDFSVIEITKDEKLLHYLNPFFKTKTKISISEDLKLFPDKLQDVNGHTLNLLAFNDTPNVFYKKDGEGNIELDGVNAPLLRLVSAAANFRLNFIEIEEEIPFVKIVGIGVDQLREHKIDLFTETLDVVKTKQILTAMTYQECEGIAVVVPVIRAYQFHVLFELIFNVAVMQLIVITVIYLAQTLKIMHEPLNFLVIIQILFGVSLQKQPRQSSDRIILLSIIILSMTYIAALYSAILKVTIIYDEQRFDKVEKIVNSGFELHVNRLVYNYTFNDNDSLVLEKLKLKTHLINDTAECFLRLNDHGNVICSTIYSKAKMLVKQYNTAAGKPIMKIARPFFNCLRPAFLVEDGFPFLEKFNTLFLRILETGTLRHSHYVKNVLEFIMTNGEENASNNLSFYLYLLLAFFYHICIAVFIVEMLVHFYFKRKCSFRNMGPKTNNYFN